VSFKIKYIKSLKVSGKHAILNGKCGGKASSTYLSNFFDKRLFAYASDQSRNLRTLGSSFVDCGQDFNFWFDCLWFVG
jgi:hypothetical protein